MIKKLVNCIFFFISISPTAGQPLLRDGTYGVSPMLLENIPKELEKPMDPLVPFDDRLRNLEALTVGFVAENSLSLSLTPKLLAFAKVNHLMYL